MISNIRDPRYSQDQAHKRKPNKNRFHNIISQEQSLDDEKEHVVVMPSVVMEEPNNSAFHEQPEEQPLNLAS